MPFKSLIGGEKFSPRGEIHKRDVLRAAKEESEKLPDYLLDTTTPPTWTFFDFAGSYHIRNVKNKFPIPGKIITYEQEKLKQIQARKEKIIQDEIENNKLLEVKNDVMKKFAADRIEYKERASTVGALGMVVENLISEKEKIVAEMNNSMFLGQKKKRKNQSEEEEEEAEREKATISLFHHCMKNIELRKVSELVKEGLNLDHPDEDGQTALIHAVISCNVLSVEFLLNNGANPNVYDKYGNTPLIWAYESYHYYNSLKLLSQFTKLLNVLKIKRIIHMLVEKGGNVNVQKVNLKDTILHRACFYNHLDIVRLLLDNDVDVNQRDRKNRSGLDIARERGHDMIVILLANWNAIADLEKYDVFKREWLRALNDPKFNIASEGEDCKIIKDAFKSRDILETYDRNIRNTVNYSQADDDNFNAFMENEFMQLMQAFKSKMKPKVDHKKLTVETNDDKFSSPSPIFFSPTPVPYINLSVTPTPNQSTPNQRSTTPVPRTTTPIPRLTTPIPRSTTPVPRSNASTPNSPSQKDANIPKPVKSIKSNQLRAITPPRDGRVGTPPVATPMSRSTNNSTPLNFWDMKGNRIHSPSPSLSEKEKEKKKDEGEKLFFSRRRKEEFKKLGKEVPVFIKKEDKIKEKKRILYYDVRGIRENYKPGSEKGRPKNWKPTKLSCNISQEATKSILRLTDPDYLKKLKVEKRNKDPPPLEYKTELEKHRKITVNSLAKDAPLLGYSLDWDESMDDLTKNLPKFTYATNSAMLRSTALKFDDEEEASRSLKEFVQVRADEAVQQSKLVMKSTEIGFNKAKKLPTWSYIEGLEDFINREKKAPVIQQAESKSQTLLLSPLSLDEEKKRKRQEKKLHFVQDKSLLPNANNKSESTLAVENPKMLHESLKEANASLREKKRPWLREAYKDPFWQFSLTLEEEAANDEAKMKRKVSDDEFRLRSNTTASII